MAGWRSDWIEAAEEIVRAEFDCSYAALPVEAEISEVLVVNAKKKTVRITSRSTMCPDSFFLKVLNIFDDLPALAPPKLTELRDELARYLSTDPEMVKDVLLWWHEHKATYPHLSQMALDYFTIPGKLFIIYFRPFIMNLVMIATSTDVEHVFSQGQLLLSHVRNRLSAQSTRALMCLGNWSLLGFVKDADIYAVTALAEVEGDEEELLEGWDAI